VAHVKILFFIGTDWAFGRIHEDLVRVLRRHDAVADVLDWRRSYAPDLLRSLDYDLVVTIPTEARVLTSDYGLSPSRVAVVAHSTCDIDKTPLESWDTFAGYAVVSEDLREHSLRRGIWSVPDVVRVGIDVARFARCAPPDGIRVLGYASAMCREEDGRDIKRGHLAARIAEEAGLVFRPAPLGTHLLAMPAYYASIDALVVTSTRESVCLPALEAAASGRLVLGTPVGVLPVLASRKAAILLPEDEASIVSVAVAEIRRYRESFFDLFQHAEAARRAVEHHYDWTWCAVSWLNFFIKARRPAER